MLHTAVVALGSNLGDRAYNLQRALVELGRIVRLVRVSPILATAPVDAPPGSPDFLNAVAAGWTRLGPLELMRELLAIERRLGRVRGRVRNDPRTIDLDLIVCGGYRVAEPELTLPHPRARQRAFVMEPLASIGLADLLGR